MKALINAGGKGTRMTSQGVEKPMLEIGGEPVIGRVVRAIQASINVDEVVVSVSPHTGMTADYLRQIGVRTVLTSGEDFMMDLHVALAEVDDDFVLTCPSDLPLISSGMIDEFVDAFREKGGQSMLALVDEKVVIDLGLKPSYSVEVDGRRWALSGMSIVEKARILGDEFLEENYHLTDHVELAVNVNDDRELELARRLVRERLRD